MSECTASGSWSREATAVERHSTVPAEPAALHVLQLALLATFSSLQWLVMDFYSRE